MARNLLFLSPCWWRPKARIADGTLIHFIRVLLYGWTDGRGLPDKHKNQVIHRKVLFDGLLCHGHRYRIDASFQLIYFIIAKTVELVDYNAPDKLTRGFDGGRKLTFDVTLCRLQLFLGDTVLVKFFQNLQRKVNRRSGRFILRKAGYFEWSGRFARIKK